MNKPWLILALIVGVALFLWILYGYFSVRSVEEPSYEVLEKSNGYEIREYGSYIIAMGEVSGSYNQATNRGFSLIADYIFGNNQAKSKVDMTTPVVQEASEKIAMTTPVVSEEGEESYLVYFIMPTEYELEDLPEPNNEKVELIKIPSRKVAVKRFSWFATEGRIERKTSELLEALESDGFETGKVSVARYNPPFTPPFMLRNEIWVEIK